MNVWQDSKCDSAHYLIIALRRSFPSLGLHKGILDSPCPLILLIFTKRKTKRRNHGLIPHSRFTSLRLGKCSRISLPSPRVASTPNRTKTNHHWLTIYKYSTRTKSRYLARGRSEGVLGQCPRGKLPPTPKTNPNPNPNPNQLSLLFQGNCLVTVWLIETPILTGGKFYSGGNCPNTVWGEALKPLG